MGTEMLLGQALRSIVLKGSKETEERYEKELAAAEADRKQAEASFRANGAVRIKEIKQQIKQLSAEIKTAAPEQKKALGEEIKRLNAEIDSLKTPPTNRFAYLADEVKAYACCQLLFKPLLSPQTLEEYGVAFSYNEQGRLVLDADNLRESPLGDKIRSGADYIFERTHDLGEKVTRAADVNNIVLMDAGRLLNREPDKIDFALIEECHNAFNEEKAEREKKNKDIARRREESRAGIQVIKDYPDGYSIVEMLPSPVYDENGKFLHHTSLKYESDEMGHCVGRGSYDTHIGTEGWHFYSLRGPNEDGVLVPHCTISIEGGRLAQIKGNSNRAVKNRYIADVRDFVQSLDMEIPSSEKERIGYVKDISNQEVDLFNLRPGTKLCNLTLASGDYKGIQLANIAHTNILAFEGKMELKDYQAAEAIGSVGSLTLETAKDAEFYDRTQIRTEKLIVNGTHMPKHTGTAQKVFLSPKTVIDFSRDWEKVRRLEVSKYTILDSLELPVFAEGIKGGVWNNVENLTTVEMLAKMFGAEWTAAHCRVENGKTIINADLDLSGRGLTRLPKDMKNVRIMGTLNLSDNKLNDIDAPFAYPDCQKMILNNSFSTFFNPNRFSMLPYLPQGIECNTNQDVDLNRQDFCEVIKKFAIVDREQIKEENGKMIINGNLDLRKVGMFSFNNFPTRNIGNVEVTDSAYVPGWMTDFPNSQTIYLKSLHQDITVPETTEKVIIDSADQKISKIEGKNLKQVVLNKCFATYADLQKLNPNISYEGDLRVYEGNLRFSDTGTNVLPQDFSALKLNGTLIISDEMVKDYICRLPQCKRLDFRDKISEQCLHMLHPKTEELVCRNLFDLDMLPPKSNLKYISFNSSLFRQEAEEYTDFLRKATARGIICDGIEIDGFCQDLSDCLVKNVSLRWNRKEKDISRLPRMENLSILGPEYDFDASFLKDASSYLKTLDLSYMRQKVDFSVLPTDVALKEISFGDSPVQNDILEQLPKSLEKISFLRCDCSLKLESLNHMPNLKSLDIKQMNVAVDALDRVDPERLSKLQISGNGALMIRAEEIVAIHQLPPSVENDRIKEMQAWLIKEDNKVPYDIKRVVFYGTVNDILSGKHPEPVSAEEISARVKGVENFVLDSCAKIIMADERNHKTGDEKSGRAVLNENKGKKPGFYSHLRQYYSPDIEIAKAAKIVKSVLTRSIRHHPDYETARKIAFGRLQKHADNLQLNFNRQLQERGQNTHTYTYAEQNRPKGESSFNAAVREMHKYKTYY